MLSVHVGNISISIKSDMKSTMFQVKVSVAINTCQYQLREMYIFYHANKPIHFLLSHPFHSATNIITKRAIRSPNTLASPRAIINKQNKTEQTHGLPAASFSAANYRFSEICLYSYWQLRMELVHGPVLFILCISYGIAALNKLNLDIYRRFVSVSTIHGAGSVLS